MKIKLLTLLIAAPLLCYAQKAAEQSKRYVYLWDVTLSMQGKSAGCPDIWEDAKNVLKKNIEKIVQDTKTEIVIVPFQHEALIEDIKREQATPNGKKALLDYISNYEIPRNWIGDAANGNEAAGRNEGTTTMTKLFVPLNYCLDQVLEPSKINTVFFLTDGKSDWSDDETAFYSLIDSDEKWCTEAEKHNLYVFYVALTQQAQDRRLNKERCRFTYIPATDLDSIVFIQLTPQETYKYDTAIDFNKPITLNFSSSSRTTIPEGYKVKVALAANEYFQNFSSDVEVKSNNSFEITLRCKGDKNYIKDLIEAGVNNKIKITYTIAENMDVYPFQYTNVVEQTTEIEVVSTDSKIVKLQWED